MGLFDPVTYIVIRIDGDYAYLQKEEDPSAEPAQVAIARLPEGIADGSRVQRVLTDYELL
jgi:hypothetical protein